MGDVISVSPSFGIPQQTLRIFDEVDELLRSSFGLVYSVGPRSDLDCRDLRVEIIEEVLQALRQDKRQRYEERILEDNRQSESGA